ncbi:hypothetical protein MauCBS54593_007505 [Microsporum audouinii]
MALQANTELLRSPQLSDYIKKLIDSRQIPGISIALVQDGTIASAAFGKSCINPSTNLTPDTLVGVGSAGKSLTATAVALLVRDNENYPQVQFDSAMSSLLPDDFVMCGDNHKDVTVEDILTHQTGIPGHDFSVLGPNAKQPDDPRSVTRNLRNLSTVAPNRTDFVYSNMMYIVASYLVEYITGMSFSDFLEKHIFQPLGMDSTSLQPERAQAKAAGKGISTSYIRDKRTNKLREAPYADHPEFQGAGQIITTTNDYAKWVKAMINREGPITEDVYDALTESRVQEVLWDDADSENPTFYCLGWQVQDYSGHKIVSHDGGEAGSLCVDFFLPELNFGGFIFSNASHAHSAISMIKYQLIDQIIRKQRHGITSGIGISLHSLFESESQSDSDFDDDYDDDIASEKDLIRELCPDMAESQPQAQKLSLNAYVGDYWNSGYRGITMENVDGRIFVDCMDRSTGFTLTFKHIKDQTKYIAYVNEIYGSTDFPIKAEFVLENNRATRVGLQLEPRMEEYIWFERRQF